MDLTLKEKVINSGIGSKDIGERIGKTAQEVGKMFKDNVSEMDAAFVDVVNKMIAEKTNVITDSGYSVKVVNDKFAQLETPTGLRVKLRSVVGADGVECNRMHMGNYTYGLLTGIIYDSIIPDITIVPFVRKLLVANAKNINLLPVCDRYAKTGELIIWITPSMTFDTTVITDKDYIAELLFVRGVGTIGTGE